MNRISSVFSFVSFVSIALIAAVARGEDFGEGEKLFALQVQALLNEKCLACHGADPEDIAGDFDIRSRDSLLRGGESFGAEVVVEGKGDESYLYRAAARKEEGFEMPPKEAERLTDEQTWALRDWINHGATWPIDERVARIRDAHAEGIVVPTSGGLNDEWSNRRYELENLWAYQPLRVVTVPVDQHPVDWFIDRGLEKAGLRASGDAAPAQLARRMSFGLTGLPPTGEAAAEFERDYSSKPLKAVLAYTNELLATPHYGEHFGRLWLDVARYADSAGFANDYARPNAWRYRDYVVRAFNQDKPYSDFVREQIAGDELEGNDPESLVATGFLRMGPWEQTGMSVFRVTRQQWLDDVTDSVGQTFLAHALQCAKCHDHKFDPIPTRDYYRMMAVFSTTQFSERDADFLKAENTRGFDEAEAWTKAKIAAYREQRTNLNKSVSQNRQKESGEAKVGNNGLNPGDEASLARMNKNISRHTWELDKTKPIALAVYTGKTVERNNVSSRLIMPDDPWKKGYIEPDTILTGGDAFSRGESVSPGPLSAATKLGNMQTVNFPSGAGSRRLALADWIVRHDNPLTARVIVNRVWSWHFGKGLAGNPNNFGGTGSRPTHPELLDYLASWFLENGSSIKELNRLIVSSAAYRRSTVAIDQVELDAKDPNRLLYSVFLARRLTAEELRDAMLAISGELNREVGGIPCRPDINLEVAFQPRQIMGGAASVYEPDPLPTQRNRRTIYAEKVRGLRDPFLETFNQPGPDKSCELRETSTVAPQALTLLNATEVHERALALASRLMDIYGASDDRQVIQALFRRTLNRSALPQELAACLKHWRLAAVSEADKEYDKPQFPSEIKRTVMAEKTGEPYDFVEIMPAYASYVPDLLPSDLDVRTRALAQVCLVLFNSNEFAYVD